MMHYILATFSIISFLIGVYVAMIGYRAYKINKNMVFLNMCAGFFLIAISNLFEDFMLIVVGVSMNHAHLIRVPLFTIGMVMILYSIKKNST